MYAFWLIELPKKLGYFKFVLIMICHVFFGGVMILLLSEGYVNLFFFLMAFILVELSVIYYFRKELIESIKKDFKIKSKKYF
jgi:hypothetical protein